MATAMVWVLRDAAATSASPASPVHQATGPLWRDRRLAKRTFLALQVDVLYVKVNVASPLRLQLFPYNQTAPHPTDAPARSVTPQPNLRVRVRGDAWRRLSAFPPTTTTTPAVVSVEVEQYRVPARLLRQLSKYRTARRRDVDLVDRIE
jgi:hypothetical protein